MKIISIGRFTEKLDYKSNYQDYSTWSALSKFFDDIYIIVESPDNSNHCETIDNLHVYWIKKHKSNFCGRLQFALSSYTLSQRLIADNNIDVINIGEPAVAGIPAVMLKRRCNKPLVTQIQGQLLNIPNGTFGYLKSWYIKHTAKYVCKHSDRIRTVSEEIRDSILALGINKNVVINIPSRCDVNKFDQTRFLSERDSIRASFGYSSSDIIIVFTGRVVKYRDLESDLQALKIVLSKKPSYRLLVIGDGADRDRLEKIAFELGLTKYVNFYGRVLYEEIPRVLSAADIFISTPTNEGIARSVLEAMSMELPIIATRVGGTPEAITNRKNGVLVDVKSPVQIADALEYFENKDIRKRIGKAARNTIVENYEFNKLIKKFADIHFNI